jgi:hypothetical protein
MKQKDTLITVILLFIFVLTWIGESVYRSAVSSTIPENVSKEIAPITPTFDTNAIEKLKSREKITPAYDVQNIAPISPTPIALPTLPYPQNASEEGELLSQ